MELNVMQVVSDLENCIVRNEDCNGCDKVNNCRQCSFVNTTILHNALALLKGILPRVMTKEETHEWLNQAKTTRDPVWFEVKNGLVACVATDVVFKADDWESIKDEYGKTWRCWSGSRPSEELRNQTEWE